MLLLPVMGVQAAQVGYFNVQDRGSYYAIIDYQENVGGTAYIPATISGKPVKEIAARAFSDCSMTGVEIPSSVTMIRDEAFARCKWLTKAKLSSVTTMGYEVFKECGKLSTVILPEGLKEIGASTFLDCTSLASLNLPASLTAIGDFAFDQSGITAFTVTAGNASYSASGGVLFDITKRVLVKYPPRKAGGYSIPAGVERTGFFSFAYCSKLTSISIPSSVKVLDAGTFAGCTALSHVTIPSSVTTVKFSMFYGCTSLATVTLPSSVTQLGMSAFAYSGLTSVVLPSGLKQIEYETFYGCEKLAKVTIPSGVSSIQDHAFTHCKALGSVMLPSGLKMIGKNAFSACGNLASLDLPVGLTFIGESAFSFCSKLKTVSLPASTVNLGQTPFFSCESLTAFTVSPENPKFSAIAGFLYDKAGSSLIACPNGRSGKLVVPAGTIALGDYAFAGCVKLTSLILPSSLVTIGAYSLAGCEQVTQLRIPTGVIEVGLGAFALGVLEEITFTGDAPVLPDHIFYGAPENFVVKYYDNCAGFTSPTWLGYPSTNLGVAVSDFPEIAVRSSGGSNIESGSLVGGFGNVTIGTFSSANMVVACTGTTDLTDVAISVTGNHAADFKVSGLTSTRITAGDTIPLRIQFTPTGAGTRSAQLLITSNAENRNPFVLRLAANGISAAPEIVVMQPAGSVLRDGRAKKAFGPSTVGEEGRVMTFTIRNSGTATLTGLGISKSGSGAGDYIVTALTKKQISPGSSAKFKVTFKPKAKGTRSAVLKIKSNDTDESPFDIKLSGLGVK